MNQFHRFLILCSFSIITVYAKAQVFYPYSELGVFAGGASYIGELNQRNPIDMMRPAIGLFYRYANSTRYSWRFMANGSRIENADSHSKIPYQQQRNLSFRTDIYELGSVFEFNYFPFEAGEMSYIATPYLFVGLSGFYFNPKAQFNDEWVNLQPLKTEGQGSSMYPKRKPYSRLQAAIPFGMGVRLNLAPRLTLGLEWMIRKTFTDYLDDISTTYADPDALVASAGAYSALLADRSLNNPGRSNTNLQRGNPSNKDWFSTLGLSLTISFSSRKSGCAAYQ